MKRAETIVGDVSALPDHSFGTSSLTWWGVMGWMLIAGMGFVIALGAYFYLLPDARVWPPSQPPPSLRWGAVLIVIAILCEIANQWLKRGARRHDRGAVRSGLVLILVLGLVLIGLRAMEFSALDMRWDRNALGSIVWALVVLHTLHVVAVVYAADVLMALSFTKAFDGRRFSAVAGYALYWRFVVWSWVAMYVIVYWSLRWR